MTFWRNVRLRIQNGSCVELISTYPTPTSYDVKRIVLDGDITVQNVSLRYPNASHLMSPVDTIFLWFLLYDIVLSVRDTTLVGTIYITVCKEIAVDVEHACSLYRVWV